MAGSRSRRLDGRWLALGAPLAFGGLGIAWTGSGVALPVAAARDGEPAAPVAAGDSAGANKLVERARATIAAARSTTSARLAEARSKAREDLVAALRLDAKNVAAAWALADLAELTSASRARERRACLETVAAADSGNVLGLLATARLALIEHDGRAAVAALCSAVELAPADDARPRLARARGYLEVGLAKAALQDASDVREKSGDKSAEALFLAARARHALGNDAAAALAALDQLDRVEPGRADSLGLRALLEAESDVEGWEAHADQALALDDGDAFALLAKARAIGFEKATLGARPSRDAARRRRARDLLDRAVERDDRLAVVLLARASLALRDQAYEEAFRDTERLLAVDPANARALTLNGTIALRQGDNERARACFDEAIEADEALPAAYLARAELEVMGKPPAYEDGIRDLDRAIRIDNDCPEAYYLRGLAKYNSRTRRNRFKDAINDLTTAVDTADAAAGWRPTAYLVRGLSHQQLKEYADAIADFDEAEKLAGPRPSGTSDLTTLRRQRDKAREDLAKEEEERAAPKPADSPAPADAPAPAGSMAPRPADSPKPADSPAPPKPADKNEPD